MVEPWQLINFFRIPSFFFSKVKYSPRCEWPRS
jgi:hypothetical protein